MYCGKHYGDICKNDNECSSKRCNEKGYCNKQLDGPVDGPIDGPVDDTTSTYKLSINPYMLSFGAFLCLIIFIVIVNICYKCFPKHKKIIDKFVIILLITSLFILFLYIIIS